MSGNMDEKYRRLLASLKSMERMIVAFSGGVDSTFLLKAASESGAGAVVAVTGDSASVPREELEFTKEFTASLGIRHIIIHTEELNDPNYRDNPPDRCYYCKKELFRKIRTMAERDSIPNILDGTNADDARDWRPGMKAASEEGVISPLMDAGLGKEEIRALSKRLGLPTWNKPATPCLSSRFPYGVKISAGELSKVYEAECFLRECGFREFRVRSHGDMARLEIPTEDFQKITDADTALKVATRLRSLGFRYVTLDLRGFRSGSANEDITDSMR
jgi:uncharacterized protein